MQTLRLIRHHFSHRGQLWVCLRTPLLPRFVILTANSRPPPSVYMASCGGTTCTGVNSDGLSWFKIDQSGLISGTVGNGVWGMGELVNNNSSWTSTIPSTLKSGAYLIRYAFYCTAGSVCLTRRNPTY